MNRSKIGALATVVLTASLMLGATAGQAAAAKPSGKGTTKATAAKGNAAKSRPAKTTKAPQPVTAQKRVVAERIARTDAALERQSQRVSASGVVEAPVVLGNIAADREVLAGYATDLTAATTITEVRAITALVGSIRPEVYSLVVSGLRLAAHSGVVSAAADLEVLELADLAGAKELEGHDVTAARALLADVSAATAQVPALSAAVVDAGIVLTARSAATEREAFATQVEALDALLADVELHLTDAAGLLAAMVPVTEPVVEPVLEPVA